MNPSFWEGKTVFLTGHTGFKGGWIAHWLHELGAAVHGYSLQPPTHSNFFAATQLQRRLARSTIADIRDLNSLTSAIKQAKPGIIIHMAAQPLVRESYNTPVDTFATYVMASVNVLEAARNVGTCKAIVNITTDKCYENKEWPWSYRENDRLGGHDPYSASKACAEIVTSAYRRSFLADANIHLASARAGNVIGGGDWASDRLIPDFLRSLDAGETLTIRSPNAIRPWQHVLEPLLVISCWQRSSIRRAVPSLKLGILAQMTTTPSPSVGLWINYVRIRRVRVGKSKMPSKVRKQDC